MGVVPALRGFRGYQAMNGGPLKNLTAWVAWASNEIDAKFQKAKWHADAGRKALAEEEVLIGQAMLALMSGFKRMVLDDEGAKGKLADGQADQE